MSDRGRAIAEGREGIPPANAAEVGIPHRPLSCWRLLNKTKTHGNINHKKSQTLHLEADLAPATAVEHGGTLPATSAS